jgi:hypothetical protein
MPGGSTRPSIYGFMRVATNDLAKEEADRIKRELSEFASREGFCLEQVFTECLTNNDSAFYAMLDALKRGEVRDVLVPSLWHFARLPGLQEAMKQHIELETGARLWVVQGQGR